MPLPKVIDLFAGAGGMTTGFVKAGFEPAFAVELDLHAAATYAVNHGESHVHRRDIADVDEDDLPYAEVVIGGPPCQGFSNLGSRDVDDPRNSLWREYLRVVTTVQPQIFVLENVARFFKSNEFALLKHEADSGLIRDYELTPVVVNAANYGVAQRRPRTIVIGSRVGVIDAPPPTHSDDGALGTKQWRTVRGRIGAYSTLPTLDALPMSEAEFFGERVPGIFKSADLHLRRRPEARSIERYRQIKPGGNRFDLPDHLLSDCWRNKATGTSDVMGRMQWDRPSLTIRTEFFKPEKGQYLHPGWHEDPGLSVDRPITHLEAARLQDFPESYQWCGTKISIARQIGNAVPVGLANAVAQHVLGYLK